MTTEPIENQVEGEIPELSEWEAMDKFLRTEKIAELLRVLGVGFERAIYVPLQVGATTLETEIAEAALAGKTVVVTGAAGGGKTMLVRHVMHELADQGVQAREWRAGAPEVPGSVSVVMDLSSLDEGAIPDLGPAMASGHLLLAANEGALMQYRRQVPEFDRILRLLHEMQSGSDPLPEGNTAIIDLGGTDPVARALEQIVSNDLILAVAARQVDTNPACIDDPETCPRSRSLDLLRRPDVRNRLVRLVSWASHAEVITFRNLWDFATDLLLGGDCSDDSTPTSAWFFRVFYGDSRLATVVRNSLAPWEVVSPGLSARAHYGDLGSLQEMFGSDWVGLPGGMGDRSRLDWIQAQAAFLGGIDYLLSDLDADDRTSATDVVRALNAYMRFYGDASTGAGQLNLWIELSVRRRDERIRSMFSMGQVPAAALTLVHPRITLGLERIALEGKRRFLVPVSESAGLVRPALLLDGRLNEALRKGRAARSVDRSNDDVDWAITSFYARLSDWVGVIDRSAFDTIHFGDGGPERIDWALRGSDRDTARPLVTRNQGPRS